MAEMDDETPMGEADESSKVSSLFAKKSHELVDDCSAEELAYIMDCCNERQESMGGEKKDSMPTEYSSKDMPKD